ncbi:hypothetical protein [Natrinema gelatinilyticum]|uniref:hypothetical protein n=1 Tax=Natrinema gelatinilyticum TaxID=2961571 RepID=UPI0020C4624B|nr:hypothetical protein [Natrinema gelatinilyticum]
MNGRDGHDVTASEWASAYDDAINAVWNVTDYRGPTVTGTRSGKPEPFCDRA